MFLSEAIPGTKEHPTPSRPKHAAEKLGIDLLKELQDLEITSNTGLTERRALIQTWTPDDLVRAYTALRVRILQKGALDYADRILIEAMEKEGIETGGTHTTSIKVWTILEVHHGEGLTITNSRGDTMRGGTRLGVWKTLLQ